MSYRKIFWGMEMVNDNIVLKKKRMAASSITVLTQRKN